MKKLLSIVSFVGLTSVLTVVLAAPCTHYFEGCQTYQDWSPGGICCLSVGGTPCRPVEVGETVGAIPLIGSNQCGSLRETIILPCSVAIGYCGNIHCTSDCE
jgi:hypothetical protein